MDFDKVVKLQKAQTIKFMNGVNQFYVHGTVHRNSVSINAQQDATIHSLFYL
jgi:hypothetical protein